MGIAQIFVMVAVAAGKSGELSLDFMPGRV